MKPTPIENIKNDVHNADVLDIFVTFCSEMIGDDSRPFTFDIRSHASASSKSPISRGWTSDIDIADPGRCLLYSECRPLLKVEIRSHFPRVLVCGYLLFYHPARSPATREESKLQATTGYRLPTADGRFGSRYNVLVVEGMKMSQKLISSQ